MKRSKFHRIVERVFELDNDLDSALRVFPALDEDEENVVKYLHAGQVAKAKYEQWLKAQAEVTYRFNKLGIE